MRICLITTATTLHSMGGTEIQAEALAAEAARQGHKVFILTSAHPGGEHAHQKDGYTVVHIPGTHFSMSRKWVKRWEQELPRAAAALEKKEAIDIFWAENFSGLPYAALPRKDRAPLISIVNGLAIKGEIASNFAAVSNPKELLYFLTGYAGQVLFYYIPWFKALARDSDLIAAVSRETAAALEEELPDSRGKIEIVYNPVNCGLFKPDTGLKRQVGAGLGLSSSAVGVMMSGVLHPQKGMHLGLAAFALAAQKFPAARLLIAGDGPQRAYLEKTARQLGLAGRAIFCGMKPNAEMPGLYNAADIYLNPTLRREGLGIVNLEAMACGLPCVISKIGGTGSTIDDGVSGYFTRPGDIAGMAEKISRLLGDPALREKMGGEGRKKAETVFEKSAVVGRYIAASEKLLSGPGR